jgi:hypothetical protein
MPDAPSLTDAVNWVADCRWCDREIVFLAPKPRSGNTGVRSTRCGVCGQPESTDETLRDRRVDGTPTEGRTNA